MTTIAPPPVANPVLLDPERQALLAADDNASNDTEYGSLDASPSSETVYRFGADEIPWTTMGVLLLGVFVVNSDSAVLFTLFHSVASDFNKLSSASWIVTSYTMGLIATQALYGKLSDIFGRKPLLLVAYSCTLIGSIIGGFAFSFPWVLAGRTIAGMGNAGMMALISTIILDLVPIEDVAVWRSYVYAVNQIGRSTGLPIGGLIADSFHWRWSLLLPAPFMLFGLLYLWKALSLPSPPQSQKVEENDNASKVKRIDFSGAISLGVANLSLLFFFDKMQRDPESAIHDPWTLFPISSWLGFMLIFLGVEAFVAQEPILPLRMLVRRNVATSYCVQFTQGAIIMGFYTTVPLYFRIENNDSSTTAALRMAFSTLGTIAGGLTSGYIIKRTGLYRLAIKAATVISLTTFLIIFIRWRGPTGWLDTITLCFPVGFSFGISLSAAFIALAAGLEPHHMAVSTSGFYLAMNIGSLTGVSAAATLISMSVRRILKEDLKALPNADDIIKNITSSFEGIKDLPDDIAKTVQLAYTESFPWVWLLGIIFCSISLAASFAMLEGQIVIQQPLPVHVQPSDDSRNHQENPDLILDDEQDISHRTRPRDTSQDA